MIAAAILATIAAVLIGREVLRQQEFPSRHGELSVATPANAIVEWCQANLGDITSAISDFVLIYLLDPIQDLLTGVPWWMVAGAFALIAWRVSGLRLAVGMFACVAGDRHARYVGLRDGHPELGPRRGRHHLGLRHPVGDPGRAERPVREALEARPGCDADDAGVRVPGAGAVPDGARSRARRSSPRSSTPCRSGSGSRTSGSARSRRRSSRQGARSARPLGSSCGRSSCRSPGRRSSWASTRRS